MPKSSKSTKSSLVSAEVTAALQGLIEAAVATALQGQKPSSPPSPSSPSSRRTTVRPTKQARKVEVAPPRDRHGFRGIPAPLENFSLANLSNDSFLTEYETAAITRLSVMTLAAWRQRSDPPLRFTKIISGRVRYQVGEVRRFLASGERPRRGRPKKKPAAAPPKPRSRLSGTSTVTAEIHAPAPERRRVPRRLRAAAAPQEASS